jgi:hypothetical protein
MLSSLVVPLDEMATAEAEKVQDKSIKRSKEDKFSLYRPSSWTQL